MEKQQCPNCSAPLNLSNNRDGTTSYVCDYCGYRKDNKPETTSDKLFSLANRVITSMNERRDPMAGIPSEEELARMSPKERKRWEIEIRRRQAIARAGRRW